jgi:ribonuclease HI
MKTVISFAMELATTDDALRAPVPPILEYEGKRKIVGDFLGAAATNRRRLLQPVSLEALGSRAVELISDSQYVVKTMTGLFKRKANLDFWQRLGAAKLTASLEMDSRSRRMHSGEVRSGRAPYCLTEVRDQLELDAI